MKARQTPAYGVQETEMEVLKNRFLVVKIKVSKMFFYIKNIYSLARLT